MIGKDVIEYYRTHFSNRVLFQGGQVFYWTNTLQARDVAKLSFNINASLTSVNLAKVDIKKRNIPF